MPAMREMNGYMFTLRPSDQLLDEHVVSGTHQLPRCPYSFTAAQRQYCPLEHRYKALLRGSPKTKTNLFYGFIRLLCETERSQWGMAALAYYQVARARAVDTMQRNRGSGSRNHVTFSVNANRQVTHNCIEISRIMSAPERHGDLAGVELQQQQQPQAQQLVARETFDDISDNDDDEQAPAIAVALVPPVAVAAAVPAQAAAVVAPRVAENLPGIADLSDGDEDNGGSYECGICMNPASMVALRDCGHCICRRCLKRIVSMVEPWHGGPRCPTCRRRIEGFMKIYL